MNDYIRSDRAVSDALGAVILISVVALGISIAVMGLLSNPAPPTVPALDADISNSSTAIYLRHTGGDTLFRNEMSLIVNGVDQTSEFVDSSGSNAWQSWAAGDTLSSTVTSGQMPESVQIVYRSGSFSQLIHWIGAAPMVTRVTAIPTVPTSPTPVPPHPVVADFSGLPVSGKPGQNVQFTDRSTGPVTTWLWSFGDGTTATTENPAHPYLLTGRYRVTLTVGNGSGFSSKSVDRYITINPDPAWYDCRWGYRKNITIQHSRVSGTLNNFPVLISLSADSDLRDHARSDGHDILFTDSGGTVVIPHEIGRYTSSTGDLIVWVNVPAVSSTANTTIYLYYGNPSSPDMQNRNGVWDADYRAVWHLDEGGTGTRYDSTSNANNANPRNYAGTEGTTGQVLGADRLHGSPTNDYLESSGNIGITGNSARTISFWVNHDDTSRNGIVGWGTNANRQEFEAGVRSARYFLWGYGAGNDWDTGLTPATGGWHYITVIFDGTRTVRWYVDGVQAGTKTNTFNYATPASHVFIGYEYDRDTVGGTTTISYLKGVIDEVRISGIARSADWITTENNDQASPGTFTIPGSEEMWYC